MNPKTKAEFDKLQSQSSNKTCIDCNAFNPQWASVNNACFMCIKCAGNHRSMGVHITFVRSVTMDSWSKSQLQRMKCGGNGKLKRFWSKQKFPKKLSPKQRLDNKAMDKYREKLLSLAKGENPSEIPYIGYIEREYASKSLSNISAASHSSSSLSSIHSAPNSSVKMEGFGNTDYTPNNSNNDSALANQVNDTWNDFSGWATTFAAKTTAVASDLAQKSKEKASTLKNKIGDEEYQANLKKNASETWNKTSKTLSSWWSNAATSVTNVINENLANADKDPNEAITLYQNDKQQHKKMPALSSAQYFEQKRKKMPALSSEQYFEQKNGSKAVQIQEAVAKQEDILGMNAMNNGNMKRSKVNNNAKVKEISDDFDDWGFEENDNNDNNDKKEETQNKKQKEETVESLLDFNDNQLNDKKVNNKAQTKEKDGNSSDELDAFFNEIENESNDENTTNKTKTKQNEDIDDLLTSHQANKDGDEDNDDWGW